jgi:glycosyltransferase involved in cell wall biosynthesis
MRILLIHNFYQQFGGEDQIVLQEMEQLKKEHEVYFYSRHNDELIQLGAVQKAQTALSTIDSRTTRTQIAAVVAEFRPDVAFIHNIYPLISPSLYHALHALSVPMVQVIHDFRPLCSDGQFYNDTGICERCIDGNHLHAIRYSCYRGSKFLSALYAATMSYARKSGALAKIDSFICLTEFARQKVIQSGIAGGEKIYVKPHSIDASHIKTAIGSGDYVGFIGRLSREKGVWTLVKAFEKLDGPVLKIAGKGPLEEPIRQYIQEKGIRNIELVGFVSGDAKTEFFRNSQFMVVPSGWFEMFGLVVLEAWAAGKPVIGSRLGALPDLIEDGKNGLLFNPGDSDDLAEKIDLLYRSPGLIAQMGTRSRWLVDTKYTPKASDEQLTGIFRKTCNAEQEAFASE